MMRFPLPRTRLRIPAALLPITLLLVLYRPGLGGALLYLRDLGSHQLGWHLLWARTVAAGRLPLWDPITLGGSPMLANPNTLSLYPPTVLFLLLPAPRALALYLLLHQVLLALGTALLLRRLSFGGRAVLLGAVAAAGSGLAFSQTAFMNGPAAMAWTPFLLAAAVMPPGVAVPSRRRIAEAAAAGAMLLLVAKPTEVLVAWTGWGLITLLGGGFSLRRVLRALPAPLLAAAMAAPLLLPALQVVPGSWRVVGGVSSAAVAADSFAPRRWPEVVLPRLYGQPVPELPGGFWAAPSFPWLRYELDLHVGTLTLLLLLLAARDPRARPWFLATGLLAVLAALPGALLALRGVLPPLRLFRYTIKFLVPAAVTMAPVAAAGALRAWQNPRHFRRGALLFTALLVPLLVLALRPSWLRGALVILFPGASANLALPGVAQAVAANLRLDVAVALLPLLAAAVRPRRWLLPALAVQLALGSSWLLHWDQWHRWSSPPPLAIAVGRGGSVLELYHAPHVSTGGAALHDPVRSHYGRLRDGLAHYYGTLWGVGYRGLFGPDGGEPAWMHLLAARLRQARPLDAARAARHLGAGWVLTDVPLAPGPGWSGWAGIPGGAAGARAYRLDARLPPAWMAQEVLAVPGFEALWQTLIDPDILPGVQAVVVRPGPLPVSAGGTCGVRSMRPGLWTVQTESEGPGLLVVNQADSILWRAVDEAGTPLTTIRVNGFLLGVRVPPGRHTVRLHIDGSRFRLGLGLFLPALLITVLLAVAAPTPGRPIPSDGAAPRPQASPWAP